MITTKPQEIEAGLELSLRFLEPLKAKNADLQKRVDDMAYVIQTAIHNGEDFAAYADMCNWGPELTMDHLRRLKAWADETNERRATR